MNPHIWHGIALFALGLAIAITLGVLCAHLEEREEEARRRARLNRRATRPAERPTITYRYVPRVWPEPTNGRREWP